MHGAQSATLEASQLSLAAVSDLDAELKSLGGKGWDLDHNQIRVSPVRVDWKAHERVQPLPQVSNQNLREFMLTGETGAPTPAAGDAFPGC